MHKTSVGFAGEATTQSERADIELTRENACDFAVQIRTVRTTMCGRGNAILNFHCELREMMPGNVLVPVEYQVFDHTAVPTRHDAR